MKLWYNLRVVSRLFAFCGRERGRTECVTMALWGKRCERCWDGEKGGGKGGKGKWRREEEKGTKRMRG